MLDNSLFFPIQAVIAFCLASASNWKEVVDSDSRLVKNVTTEAGQMSGVHLLTDSVIVIPGHVDRVFVTWEPGRLVVRVCLSERFLFSLQISNSIL